jgi:hypothetical protein
LIVEAPTRLKFHTLQGGEEDKALRIWCPLVHDMPATFGRHVGRVWRFSEDPELKIGSENVIKMVKNNSEVRSKSRQLQSRRKKSKHRELYLTTFGATPPPGNLAASAQDEPVLSKLTVFPIARRKIYRSVSLFQLRCIAETQERKCRKVLRLRLDDVEKILWRSKMWWGGERKGRNMLWGISSNNHGFSTSQPDQ